MAKCRTLVFRDATLAFRISKSAFIIRLILDTIFQQKQLKAHLSLAINVSDSNSKLYTF